VRSWSCAHYYAVSVREYIHSTGGERALECQHEDQGSWRAAGGQGLHPLLIGHAALSRFPLTCQKQHLLPHARAASTDNGTSKLPRERGAQQAQSHFCHRPYHGWPSRSADQFGAAWRLSASVGKRHDARHPLAFMSCSLSHDLLRCGLPPRASSGSASDSRCLFLDSATPNPSRPRLSAEGRPVCNGTRSRSDSQRAMLSPT